MSLTSKKKILTHMNFRLQKNNPKYSLVFFKRSSVLGFLLHFLPCNSSGKDHPVFFRDNFLAFISNPVLGNLTHLYRTFILGHKHNICCYKVPRKHIIDFDTENACSPQG